MADDFPIGTVLPFAGSWEDSSAKLQAMGWTLCDGSPVAYGSNQALYTVIGNDYGADETGFRLPDFRGYFLRAVDSESNGQMDPDADSRVPPSKLEQPGNSGRAVGSVQPHGVGPHEHQIVCFNQMSNQGGGSGDSGVTESVSPSDNYGTQGGDNLGRETRPVNMYVHFIIKVKNVAIGTGAAALPGTVIYYAAEPDPSQTPGWLWCDGSSLDSSYTDLAGVIEEFYGATGDNQVLVPDYRGVFLRGVDESATTDPDALARTPPRPDQPTQGNRGATVGSWQEGSIAPHTHDYPWPPPLVDQCNCLDGCPNVIFFRCCSYYTDMQTTTDGSGSDGVSVEVRPRNTYVHHLIAAITPTATTPLTIPVGTVIGYAGPGSTMTDTDWNICSGGWSNSASYPAFNKLIGSAFGGNADGSQFLMPWYLGMLLRGVDGGRGIDAQSGARTAPATWAPNPGNTGDAVGSYQGDCITPHTHQYLYLRSDNAQMAGTLGSGTQVALPNSSLQPTGSSTGASDTRPVNAYVNFFIRAQ
jgi:microcystin-dependent protein